MRILMDAHLLGSGETGNETYTRNLINSLCDLPSLEVVAAILKRKNHGLNRQKISLAGLRSKNNWIRLAYDLPAVCKRWNAEIVHVTYIGPFFLPCPLVVTLHDVAFKKYPEFFSWRDRILFSTLLLLSLKRSAAILAISNHGKSEIIKYYPFLEGKVFVTMLAANPIFRKIDDKQRLEAIRKIYQLDGEYLLAVGNIQPRKNLLRILEAYDTVRKKIIGLKLVIVGKAKWKSSIIYEEVTRRGLERDVIFTGYVSDDELVFLYNGAKLFLYPSIYEGFGLPILEAMSCGTPVITSNTASMPEVAGNAAMLIDPLDTDQIGEGIEKVIKSPDLSKEMSIKGLRQAAKFSWEKTARDTFEVYRNILTNRNCH